jgi:hypothetical protein
VLVYGGEEKAAVKTYHVKSLVILRHSAEIHKIPSMNHSTQKKGINHQ